MVSLRLAAASLVVVALALGAGSAGARTVAPPTGLRAFLLRADEPSRTAFPRTPAFAWNPVQGATGYEFQLSTSSAFRDNGIVWQCPSAKCQSLPTPVAAPEISLPWITGNPHGLYARVRADLPDGSKTDWSASFGFDVAPPSPPTPLPSQPGLLRWTPVPGADAYQVWLIDAKKFETVTTNALDERDFYTFHRTSAWMGSVRWRIRVLRADWNSDQRVNGVPVTQYGAWSPIYNSANPTVMTGLIKLGSTISDVVANGAATDLAHRLMPAFTWTGDQTLDGTQADLFRVYVFTDKQCLNRVFTSSIVGSPAYAPRPYGGLNLPGDSTSLTAARSGYTPDLSSRSAEPPSTSYDGEGIKSSESAPAATPTTGLPGLSGSGSVGFLSAGTGDLGAPVSLWDDDWPKGGYYWTVIPVQVQFPGAIGATLSAGAPYGSKTVLLSATPAFVKGDQVQLGTADSSEVLTIDKVSPGAITFTTGTLANHDAGAPIVRLGGSVVYQDLELAQEVCAAGRVSRFGINSEPSLIAGDDPFASGLSPRGQLASAVSASSFYKSPVVSWTPVLGAQAYQVQWSKSATPFVPVAGPSGAAGILTGSTSYVLPLAVGTWYYRVRGYDWQLPTGAQQMGWSDPAKIVVSNATFKVVQSVKTKPKKR